MDVTNYSVNGLNSLEIIVLYDLLVRYEQHFKSMNLQEFNQQYPKYKGISKLLNLEKKTYAELEALDGSIEINHIYMTIGKNPKEFIKRLRNAFAHSLLIKTDNEVEIRDYMKRKGSKGVNTNGMYLSAYGRISADKFKELIDFLSDQIK